MGELDIRFDWIRKGNDKLRMAEKELKATLELRKGVLNSDDDKSRVRKSPNPEVPGPNPTSGILWFFLIICVLMFCVSMILLYLSIQSHTSSTIVTPAESEFPAPINNYYNYYPTDVKNFTQIKEKVVLGEKKDCLIIKDIQTGVENWKCEV